MLATFRRGFYILDDIGPLRAAGKSGARQGSRRCSQRRTPWMFIPAQPNGGREKAFFGDRFFSAPNPPFGAVFTYYLKDEIKTRRKTRARRGEGQAEEGRGTRRIRRWDDLREEDREEDPAILLTVTGSDGAVVRRF